jgi:hypothetical protein
MYDLKQPYFTEMSMIKRHIGYFYARAIKKKMPKSAQSELKARE